MRAYVAVRPFAYFTTHNLLSRKNGPFETALNIIQLFPVCSIVKTITPRCRGRTDALLHEAEGRVQ